MRLALYQGRRCAGKTSDARPLKHTHYILEESSHFFYMPRLAMSYAQYVVHMWKTTVHNSEKMVCYLFSLFATRSSTTPGSASVDVSPRLLCSLAAILRRMRRMILPERVFGRAGAN